MNYGQRTIFVSPVDNLSITFSISGRKSSLCKNFDTNRIQKFRMFHLSHLNGLAKTLNFLKRGTLPLNFIKHLQQNKTLPKKW